MTLSMEQRPEARIDLFLRLKEHKIQIAVLVIAIAILVILPYVISAGLITIITGDLIFLQLAYSWNLVGGYLGEMSLGHMIFWAIGSFGTIIAINNGLPLIPVIAVMCGVGVVAGLGMALAIRLAKLEGLLYVAIFTLILGEVVAHIANNWHLLGASVGLVSIHASGIGFVSQYEILVAVVAVAMAVNVWVSVTRRGVRWQALRDDVQAAETIGVKITSERMVGYALSAALCVMGGAFQGYYLGSASGTVSLDVSTLIIVSLAVFVGGPGKILGPLAGWIVIYGLGSVVTSVSTSINVSLYAQVVEFVVALIALRLVVPRLANRDLLSGVAWIIKSSYKRLRRDTDFVNVKANGIASQNMLVEDLSGSGYAEAQQKSLYSKHSDLEIRSSETSTTATPSASTFGVLAASRNDDVGTEPLILDGVVKSFGKIDVLKGVSFQVRPGEVVGLLGSNGAGKSTLCNILSGIFPASGGSLKLGEIDMTHLSMVDRSLLGVGRSFQTPRLFPSLSLMENLAVSETIGYRRAAEILQSLSISGDDARISRESDFFARRLTEVARAAALGSQLLLLDEPLAGLTEEQHDVVLDLARGAALNGSRVIVVEHLIPVVAPVVDRLIVLAGGVVIADGIAADVLADENVIQAYLGNALVVES